MQHEIIRLEGQIREKESKHASLLVQVDVLTARAVAAESKYEILDAEREQALQQALDNHKRLELLLWESKHMKVPKP